MSGESQYTVPDAEHGARLDASVSRFLGCGVRAAKRLIEDGLVSVDGQIRPAQFKLKAGAAVAVTGCAATPPGTSVHIAGAGGDYIFFNKPAGLHTAHIAGKSSPSLERALAGQWRDLRRNPGSGSAALPECLLEALGGPAPNAIPAPVPLPEALPQLLTRLDAATSGLVLAAFSPAAAERFRKMEATGLVSKYYLAVVHGDLSQPVTLTNALDVDNRKTTRVLPEATADNTRHTEVWPLRLDADAPPFPVPGASLVAVRIRRGARHQIRAHLAHAGYPIAGDTLYGPGDAATSLYLHHARLVFPDYAASCPPPWFPIP